MHGPALIHVLAIVLGPAVRYLVEVVYVPPVAHERTAHAVEVERCADFRKVRRAVAQVAVVVVRAEDLHGRDVAFCVKFFTRGKQGPVDEKLARDLQAALFARFHDGIVPFRKALGRAV